MGKAHLVFRLSFEGIFSCACFFNAHCDLYLEFQMLFFPFLFPLSSFLSGCSVNSILCLRLDTSQSVIPKRKKTFIRYKITSLSYCCSTTSNCTARSEGPRALSSRAPLPIIPGLLKSLHMNWLLVPLQCTSSCHALFLKWLMASWEQCFNF